MDADLDLEQFCAGAARRLGHLFPRLPKRPGYVKRRQRLADTIEALIAEFAAHSPGSVDDLLVVDSTPVECGRSIETMRRSALADAADMATAPATAASSGAFACTASSRSTAPRAR